MTKKNKLVGLLSKKKKDKKQKKLNNKNWKK